MNTLVPCYLISTLYFVRLVIYFLSWFGLQDRLLMPMQSKLDYFRSPEVGEAQYRPSGCVYYALFGPVTPTHIR